MAYKKVVEMLGKNLASLLELAKKWLITWNLPLGKILHTLHHIKKSDLRGLIYGNCEIVKTVFDVKAHLFMKQFYKINYNSYNNYRKLNLIQTPIDTKNKDFNSNSKKVKTLSFGEYTLNPDLIDIDWDRLIKENPEKIKFIPFSDFADKSKYGADQDLYKITE